MDDHSVDHDTSKLLRDVTEAAKLPPKARSANIKPTVADLASAAYDRGLLPGALQDAIALLTSPTHLDQASLASIARNLYPTGRVSRQVTLRVVASLGHGSLKPSLNIQATLIRWLILVYHVLESPAILSQAYQVLFGLLDTAATRPQLTHLLALVTRRKHVKPFRIQSLMALSRQTGNDPCLVGLLRVYKDYYPEIIVGEAVRGKASAFKHPDPLWRSRLDEIQDAHIQQTQDVTRGPRDGFRVNRPLNRAQRNKAVPLVHTAHVNENSVTLEEIENATSLAQSIDRLELPNQLVAVLADPVLQKLLLLRHSEEAYQRIVNWLYAVLQDAMSGNTDEDTLWDILDVVKDFVKQTNALPPILLNFFARFFEMWDGSGRRDVLYEILSRAPLLEFQELDSHIFQPFEAAVLKYSTDYLDLLTLYTNLLQHWTAILYSSNSIPGHASRSVEAVVRHVEPLAQTLFQVSPTEQSQAAILLFYEQIVRLVTDKTLKQHIKIELPPSALVYTLFFSSSLTTLSRLCNILAQYKRGFETAMLARRQDPSSRGNTLSYEKAQVSLYNSFLMDICNCLWRSRAFRSGDANANGCMVPERTVAALTSYVPSVDNGSSLDSFLDLSHSPILCLQSIQQVRKLEDGELGSGGSIRARHGGPVTQASLSRLNTMGGLSLSWQDYRVRVLKGLIENELPGVAELLKNTMTVLKNAMDGNGTALS